MSNSLWLWYVNYLRQCYNYTAFSPHKPTPEAKIEEPTKIKAMHRNMTLWHSTQKQQTANNSK